MGSEAEVRDRLHDVFKSYVALAGKEAVGLDGARFAKLCRDAHLVSPPIDGAAIDLIFTRAKERGARRLSFREFVVALGLVGDALYPGDQDGFGKVRLHVCAGAAPEAIFER